MLELDTPRGLARVHLRLVESAVAGLVLGHGAGGGIEAPDLVAAAEAARSAGISVALVEQPYRVAGRRAPPPAPQLDEAWTSVVQNLRGGPFGGKPLISGGRSSGARVACRTAAETASVAVICLAFPLHPPGRPDTTRLPELDAVRVPTLVVQGRSDSFGMPPPRRNRTVTVISGTHSLRNGAAVASAVSQWLATLDLRPCKDLAS